MDDVIDLTENLMNNISVLLNLHRTVAAANDVKFVRIAENIMMKHNKVCLSITKSFLLKMIITRFCSFLYKMYSHIAKKYRNV